MDPRFTNRLFTEAVAKKTRPTKLATDPEQKTTLDVGDRLQSFSKGAKENDVDEWLKQTRAKNANLFGRSA